MFTVYILKNDYNGGYYISYTSDIKNRLERHNNGHSKFTKNKGVWRLVYFENFESKSDSIKREKYIKNQKSKIFIESLIYRGVEK